MKKQPKYKIDNAKLTRLAAKAQKGNEKATEDVVNMISGYLYYYSLGMLGDEEKAKDAVQDILLMMLQKLDTLEDPKAFLGWIKMMTANHCHNLITRKKSCVSIDEVCAEYRDEDEQVCPEKAAESAEVCSIVRGAVNALPLNQRESVLMFYFQQLSIREIAEALSVSENTVKSRLFSARQSLKKKLEAAGAAAFASCAIPAMKLISFSLITEAEEQTGVMIPYTTPSSAVKVASFRTAPAASALPLKIAAAACAALIVTGGVCATITGARSADSGKAFAGSPVKRPQNAVLQTTAQETAPETVAVLTSPSLFAVSSETQPSTQLTVPPAEPAINRNEPLSDTEETVAATVPAQTVPETTIPETTVPPETQPVTQPATEPATQPPKTSQPIVYFNTTGWQDFTKVYCYVHEKGGEGFYTWMSKQTLCTHYRRSFYSYDLSALDLDPNKQYVLIFSADNGAQTSSVEFTTARYGETVELKSANQVWGNSDSSKHTYDAGWK